MCGQVLQGDFLLSETILCHLPSTQIMKLTLSNQMFGSALSLTKGMKLSAELNQTKPVREARYWDIEKLGAECVFQLNNYNHCSSAPCSAEL